GDSMEVLYSEPSRHNCVSIADGFGVLAWIGTTRIGCRKPQPGLRVLFPRPSIERILLVIGRARTRNRLVAPHSRPLVVWSNPGNEILRRNMVFRLSDVIEPAVIHQRWRMAHCLQPLWIAHLFNRVCRTRLHVVLESQRVTNFMGN